MLFAKANLQASVQSKFNYLLKHNLPFLLFVPEIKTNKKKQGTGIICVIVNGVDRTLDKLLATVYLFLLFTYE